MGARSLVASLAAAAVWLGVTAAHAEPVRLAYTVPAGCPDEAAFVAQIQARTARFERARGNEPARAFAVTVEAEGDAFRGRLDIREIDGRDAVRDVPAAPCEEVVAALALIAAVAIDPDAHLDSTPTPAPRPPPPPAQAPPPTPAPGPPREPPSPPPASRVRVGIGAHAALVTAVAPGVEPAIEAFAEVLVERPSLFSPAVRAAFLYARSVQQQTSGGAARFTWYAGRIDLCPARWPAPARDHVAWGALTACALVDLGALTGAGSGAAVSSTETRVWFAPGLAARAELFLFDHLFVEVEGGATVPVPSYRFYFDPTPTVFIVPRVGALAAAGLGVRFP